MFSLLINTLSFAGPAARLAAAPATRMATPVMQGYGLAVRDRYDMDYYGGGGYGMRGGRYDRGYGMGSYYGDSYGMRGGYGRRGRGYDMDYYGGGYGMRGGYGRYDDYGMRGGCKRLTFFYSLKSLSCILCLAF